jgi:hypothetical protein
MATRAATNVTTAIAPGGIQPITVNEDGLYIEVFRVLGGTAGDTVALTPRYITDIRSVTSMIPASDNLSTSAGNTNVTLTYGVAVTTTTTLSYCVEIKGRRNQT